MKPIIATPSALTTNLIVYNIEKIYEKHKWSVEPFIVFTVPMGDYQRMVGIAYLLYPYSMVEIGNEGMWYAKVSINENTIGQVKGELF